MELTSQQRLPVGQAQAWDALNDIGLLQASIPGCDSFTPTGEREYEVGVMAAIGPVKARFKGQLKLEDFEPPQSYTLQFSGQGGQAGHAKGSARIRLEAVGPAETVLHYTAQAAVGGKIAQLGSRLVDMAAQKMAADFFSRFNAALQERYPPPPEVPAAAPAAAAPAHGSSWWERIVGWFRRLAGGGR
jgi:hypothetical protein